MQPIIFLQKKVRFRSSLSDLEVIVLHLFISIGFMVYTKILFFAALMFATRFFEPDGCDNFSVVNESSYTIGIVVVTGAGGTFPIDVTDTGLFADTLCFTPFAVVINGQSASYPDTTVITLADESKVNVTWQSTQLVDIANKQLDEGRRH
jgi:hypothetical protein